MTRSERERQIPYVITYMWNLKYGTNKLIYETDPQTWITDLWLPKGRGMEKGLHVFPLGGQLGPVATHCGGGPGT